MESPKIGRVNQHSIELIIVNSQYNSNALYDKALNPNALSRRYLKHNVVQCFC
jgi:hypothetical protein